MPFWRIVPPLPHPYWAQSVAPAGWQGRVPRQSRPPLPPRRGCRPHPSRAPSPQGGGLPTDWMHTTNALLLIALPPPPPCSGAPRRERWRTVPPSPPPARPPPLTGWISLGRKQQKTSRMMPGAKWGYEDKKKKLFFHR